jgi:rhodanese-related sulfurtransferase
LPLGGDVQTSDGPVPVGASEPKASIATISSAQLAEKLAHKDFVFVNVHVPYEGEIAQTDAFIPFDKIAENLDRLPTDRSAAIVLYCRSGRMSEIAASDLAGRGFTQVSHLSGGMIDWQRSGHSRVRN